MAGTPPAPAIPATPRLRRGVTEGLRYVYPHPRRPHRHRACHAACGPPSSGSQAARQALPPCQHPPLRPHRFLKLRNTRLRKRRPALSLPQSRTPPSRRARYASRPTFALSAYGGFAAHILAACPLCFAPRCRRSSSLAVSGASRAAARFANLVATAPDLPRDSCRTALRADQHSYAFFHTGSEPATRDRMPFSSRQNSCTISAPAARHARQRPPPRFAQGESGRDK